MSDTNDQSSENKKRSAIVFICMVAALLAIVAVAFIIYYRMKYPGEGEAPEAEAAEDLKPEVEEVAELAPTKHEKVNSPLKESSIKKEIGSFGLAEKKENDMSISGLSASSKSKKSELKEAAAEAKN
ncbi:hypothetical protein COBT_003614, partial [Conglomerata obtusa]